MKWIKLSKKTPCDYEKENESSFCHHEGVLVQAEGKGGPNGRISIAIWQDDGTWDILGQAGFYSDTEWYPMKSDEIVYWCPIEVDHEVD